MERRAGDGEQVKDLPAEQTPGKTSASVGPRKDRRFVRLWTSYSVSVLGDEVYALAVPLIVYELTRSASAMAWVYAAYLLPQVFFGVVGGAYADRGDRMRVLRLAYVAAGSTLLATWVYFLTADHPHVASLVATAIVLAVAAAVAAASVDSSIPRLVPTDRLARANSMTEASRTASVVAGPMIAGFLVAYGGADRAILLNALSFLVAFALLVRLRLRREQVQAATADLRRLLESVREGLRFLTANRTLRVGIVLSTTTNALFGAFEPILIYRLRNDLALGADAVGLVFSVAAVVSVVASIVLSWRAPSYAFGRVMTLSIVGQGLAVVALGFGATLPVVVAAQALMVVFVLVYTVYWRALRQSVCPAHVLGRVSGACRGVAYGGAFVGSLVSGVILHLELPAASLLVISGTLVTALGIGGLAVLRHTAA